MLCKYLNIVLVISWDWYSMLVYEIIDIFIKYKIYIFEDMLIG